MFCVCGQLRGVTLERNKLGDYDTNTYNPSKIVVDGVEFAGAAAFLGPVSPFFPT